MGGAGVRKALNGLAAALRKALNGSAAALRKALNGSAAALRNAFAGWAVARGGTRCRRRMLVCALLGLVLAPVPLLTLAAALTPLPDELREAPTASVRVLSRTGELLREVRASDGMRARPLHLDEFPRRVRLAVLAAEDRWFYAHPGVDPFAVARAIGSNLWHRRIVSGASTLTMQLARTLRPHSHTAWGKFREAALALRIEASLEKNRILEEYLNRVVYGPHLRGYAAASQAYLGKPPDSLSTAEAALVAGLPRGPTLYAVTQHPSLAKRRRDRVLDRMAEAGFVGAAECARGHAEPIAKALSRPSFGAPHFVTALLTREHLSPVSPNEHLSPVNPNEHLTEIRTTIDPRLQRAAESAVSSTVAALRAKHVTAAAVLVLDNGTGDILSYVGSSDFFDPSSLGQNDGVRALRQPGSALKPFVYAEAIDALGYSGATVLPDVELHIPLPGGGDYVPHDYDGKFRGPVRLREALGNSLNVPAVYALYQLGTERVLSRLHSVGFDSLRETAEHYGPALALGDGEVTLIELANAYATLARGGVFRPVRWVAGVSHFEDSPHPEGSASSSKEEPRGPEHRVMEERTASLLTDILADENARVASFGDQNALEFDFPVAAKTGTSRDYRDNWAVGYTREVTVAAWAGNFDGSPMSGVSGIAGAGPVFHAVMEAAMENRTPLPLRLEADASRLGLRRTPVCSLSGQMPTSACPHRTLEWLPETDADHAPTCTAHRRLRVDITNGLLAGPQCSPEIVEQRLFEVLDPMYENWAEHVGRPRAPRESSPRCPVEVEDDAADAEGLPNDLRITYPFDGARFLLDPERPEPLQGVDIRAVSHESRTEIYLRVDEDLVAHGIGNVAVKWQLSKGEHTLTATSGSKRSEPVHISVR